jgi:cytochrome c biogenesis factor
METQFSEKESLELIGRMINTAKNNLQKGMGNIFLLWGYLVAGISFGTCILLLVLPGETRYYSFFLWFLMAFGYPFHYRLLKKREREMLVMTYIEKVMNWVWIAFTLSILVVITGLLLATVQVVKAYPVVEPGDEFIRWFHWLFMTPFMLCLYGFALFVSGKAYRFTPLVTGGFVCWAAALLLLICIHYSHIQEVEMVVLGISAIAGYIIPGHLLNKKDRTDV